jgi:hypothetical protein
MQAQVHPSFVHPSTRAHSAYFASLCARLLVCAAFVISACEGDSDTSDDPSVAASAQRIADPASQTTSQSTPASETPRAGLVIRFANNDYCTQCVTFGSNETEMTGEELLARAGRVVAELANFGSDADPDRAVCKLTAPVNGRITTDGCDANDCFCDAIHYWAYFGAQNGTWSYHATGPTRRVVRPGDVDGYSWTEYPETLPAVVSLDEICTPNAPTDCGFRVFLPSVGR